MAPVGIERLPFDLPDAEMRRQCPADLDLKAAPPLPNVGSGRQPVAWIERDGIDLWPGCGTGPDPNDIGSQPIEIDYFS